MYLRHTTVRKNGKTHTYWRLVRSVRVGAKVRQETVAQLGELDAAGRVRARALTEALVGVDPKPGLFDEPMPAVPVAVDLRRFHLGDAGDFLVVVGRVGNSGDDVAAGQFAFLAVGRYRQIGIDYEGATCPACPFWAGRDRWTGKRLHRR